MTPTDAMIEAGLRDLRDRKLLKYLFDAEPSRCGPYGHIDEPLDLGVQREVVTAIYTAMESARDPDELREALVDELIEAAKMSEAANRLTVPDQMFATKHLNEARLALLNSLTALSRNRGDVGHD